MGIFH